MTGTGEATGSAKALCDVMGWDAHLGRGSDGLPNGGQLAVDVVDELRASGWLLVPVPSGNALEALSFVDDLIDNVAHMDPAPLWRNDEVVRMLDDVRALLVTGKVTP